MDRPYIFCHMLMSLDGKIVGKYMDTKECDEPSEQFYEIAFGKNAYYKHQGWLSGRVTTDDNFTMYRKPKLDKTAPIVPPGDFITDGNYSMYYVSIDPLGKLGWQSNTLIYETTTAHVLEVLTEKASNAYKAMLRKLNISYVIVGKDELDYKLLMEKLYHKFNIKTLMLGGGGILNWSFIQAGLCDELSLVMAPVADGASQSPSIFETKEDLTSDKPVGFELKNVEVLENGGIWLRYLIKN
ncbi:5-amino-6-(5-phosphoribosylamino)uracil reductase [Thomasclavelia spiroformis]|uniref:5-amino-6-(5-phosphoribosylamino)uracil reductase n=2 Tax=Thomasclavelia spiroformis TaxID=29348 RepID=A0A3E5FMP2_9FIRM|nr:5-amino-6-(5-phosphoribosylamino)uracil reductase [Thomasclavelia spiroformis]